MIKLQDHIGAEVVEVRTNRKGHIQSVGKYINIEFSNGEQTKRALSIFSYHHFEFVDKNLQNQVSTGIAEELDANDAKSAQNISKAGAILNSIKTASIQAANNKRSSKFGNNYNVQHLRNDVIFTYREVENICNITIQGFGRGINVRKDSIILVSSIDSKNGSFVYHDTWDDNGDYLYSGEGSTGTQELTKGNKAICDAKKEGKKIFLFVKTSPDEYLFQGEFIYIDHTIKNEADKDGNIRQELIFRIRRIAEPQNAVGSL